MLQERLRVLVVGSGGREHAFAWKLSHSPSVDIVFVAPGNGGTAAGHSKIANIDIKADDYAGLVTFSQKNNVNLVVPGPEAPLVDGIQKFFQSVGIRCFGPSQAAARMEGSKTFSKDFMKRHNIPTAAYENFSDYASASRYLDSVNHDVVIKASGLAAGKGVIIPQSKEEAQKALREMMLDRQFGEAGDEVVIEEFLEGDELSILTFSDGYTVRSLPPAQDHKRIFDGDQGPNTGGMGCYAPTRITSKEVLDEIDKTVIIPTINGMRREGYPFVGILFTGLMMTKNGPKVLEYNVRGGDPETQTLLPLLSDDTDLAEVMIACTEHWLDGVTIKIEPKFSATVIAVAEGYPGSYAKGRDISLTPPAANTLIFHAGTTLTNNHLKTSGGRVIAATSTAATLEDAVSDAYTGISTINFQGMHYRKDIAHRAFRSTSSSNAEPLTYAAAGVSIDAGNDLVKQIKANVAQTRRPGTDAIIGGFGGTFSLSTCNSGFHPSSPTLIGAIDGVGTKLAIAHEMRVHNTVGIDLVAMNVNDLVVQGAEPLFFLDCYSCGKLDVATAAAFVSGVAAGCVDAGCALVGGETAEMPGLYAGTAYDAVGAAVGAIDTAKRTVLPAIERMQVGDVLLGLASSGPHSNGYSLVRKVVERSGLSYHDAAPFETTAPSLGAALLTPTRIYVKPLLAALAAAPGAIKGLAHITGGGLVENIPRALPKYLTALVDVASWPLPPVFRWLKKSGGITGSEMGRAFNNGIGMVIVVGKEDVALVKGLLEGKGEKVFVVGELVAREEDEGCVLKSLESWE
ncbi:phosphoribosylformylglycinamidine cyclo-ligase [Histoplasma capsulatum G186AR]|uniref:Phosphoribosylformylglycinamidine cyclo-ligase n=2 Tax=Ajellomyces capsulatus TaxID=5037 RepID=C0NX78_AJECG|nr:phosphoribosylformylglycinamidine cyclo-ligase [Histoplasma capsulatum G186AR]EEH03944.1 phosphoribosylformylglycinamidine cyclo-ligase [Histoplasma capsulatum G186AR]KAG5295548.1 phosphoribosylformylglycinamidine cyclo-ligase [Histoplasma capsulatum]QSS73529.1 phosphoribosylformylglycinamidine cyclo-ligase [Histoplasma capsulatum G186AR]